MEEDIPLGFVFVEIKELIWLIGVPTTLCNKTQQTAVCNYSQLFMFRTFKSICVIENLLVSKHAEGKSGEVLSNFEEINKLHTKPDHAVPVRVLNAPGCVE